VHASARRASIMMMMKQAAYSACVVAAAAVAVADSCPLASLSPNVDCRRRRRCGRVVRSLHAPALGCQQRCFDCDDDDYDCCWYHLQYHHHHLRSPCDRRLRRHCKCCRWYLWYFSTFDSNPMMTVSELYQRSSNKMDPI